MDPEIDSFIFSNDALLDMEFDTSDDDEHVSVAEHKLPNCFPEDY